VTNTLSKNLLTQISNKEEIKSEKIREFIKEILQTVANSQIDDSKIGYQNQKKCNQTVGGRKIEYLKQFYNVDGSLKLELTG